MVRCKYRSQQLLDDPPELEHPWSLMWSISCLPRCLHRWCCFGRGGRYHPHRIFKRPDPGLARGETSYRGTIHLDQDVAGTKEVASRHGTERCGAFARFRPSNFITGTLPGDFASLFRG